MSAAPIEELRREIAARIIDALGGPNAAARAVGMNPRTAQRLASGDSDTSEEMLARLGAALRLPVEQLENIAQRIHDDSPRASVGRVRVLLAVARLGVTTMRDLCDVIGGSANDSGVHEHIKKLMEMGLIEDLGEEPGRLPAGGRNPRRVALTLGAWRELGLTEEE